MKTCSRKNFLVFSLATCLAFFSSCADESKVSTWDEMSQPSLSSEQVTRAIQSQSSGNTNSNQNTAITAGPNAFPYSVRLEEISIPDFEGLHSYAYGQYDGKWLLVGGRTDGLHARQPFASFPLAYNNRNLIVIDPETKEYWSAPLTSLSTELREHLQSSNMNFFQSGDLLYIIGGYAYSETASNFITFPKLTTLRVSEVIKGVMNGKLDSDLFGHLADPRFAVTGGQLGKIGDEFYLVGGHRFDGRYTPEATRQNIQVYTNAIQRFTFYVSGPSPEIKSYSSVIDEDQLRRRDYNLVPYLFTDERPGYLISSGVFQANANLPFLTAVEIDKESYYPVTNFEQFLSHYHSPKLSLYDSSQKSLHMLFFGGLAQFYFEDGALKQDDLVPFVTTISRVTRTSDGVFTENVLPISMPDFSGTSAEFIPNPNLPRNETGVFLMEEPTAEAILIGHMLGGITSPVANPFSFNQTQASSADSRIFRIWIEKAEVTATP